MPYAIQTRLHLPAYAGQRPCWTTVRGSEPRLMGGERRGGPPLVTRTRADAREAIRDLRTLGPDWEDAEYRVVPISRLREPNHAPSERDARSRLGYPPYPHGRAKVETVLHEYKTGRLRSSSGQRVRSRRQAVAIALSEQRRAEHSSRKMRDLPSRDPQRGSRSAWSGIDYVEKQANLWHNRLAHIILYGIDERGTENLQEADRKLTALLEERVPGNQKHRIARWWEHKRSSLRRMWNEATEVAEGKRAPKLAKSGRGVARDPSMNERELLGLSANDVERYYDAGRLSKRDVGRWIRLSERLSGRIFEAGYVSGPRHDHLRLRRREDLEDRLFKKRKGYWRGRDAATRERTVVAPSGRRAR